MVEIADEMNEAFLLATWHSIIAAIEVRYKDPSIASQGLMDNGCLSRLGQSKEDVRAIREDPDVVGYPSNADLRFINMNERTAKHSLDDSFFSLSVAFVEISEEAANR